MRLLHRLRGIPAIIGDSLRRYRSSWLLGAGAAAFYALAMHWGVPNANHALATHGWATDAVTPFGPLAQVNDWLLRREYGYPAYPLFHSLVLSAAFAPYLAYLWLSGNLTAVETVYPFGLADPVAGLVGLELIGKFVSVLAGAGLVVVTRHTAQELWGRSAGWLAAVLVGTLFPLVYYARNANLDAPMLFWAALGLFCYARITTRGFDSRRAVGIGVFVALAMATKDMAWGMFLLLPLGIAWRDIRVRRSAGDPIDWRPYLLGPAAAFGCYALAVGAIPNPGYHLAHLDWVSEHVPFPLQETRPATFSGYLALMSDLARQLSDSASPLLLVLAPLGVWATRRRPGLGLLLSASGFFVGVLLLTRLTLVRYALPITYVASLFAAAALAAGLASRRWRPLSIAAAAVAIGWQTLFALDLTYQMWNDSRGQAQAWFADIPEGTVIALANQPSRMPRLRDDVRYAQIDRHGSRADAERVLAEHEPDYVVLMPDWTAPPDGLVSRFLDPAFEAGLRDGSLGYRFGARFKGPGLRMRQILDYPTVNPPIEVFTRIRGEAETD